MKFREIKPGMVIHWKTEEEKAALLEELERIGYEWYGTKRKPTEACNGKYVGHAIFVYNDRGYKNITHSNNMGNVTHEFSELIIQELELSADEALKLYEEYCDYHICAKCKIGKFKEGNESCKCIVSHHAKEVVEILKEWKSDHEKKEPEIETEWFWQGRIFKVEKDGSYYQIKDGNGFYDTGCEYQESAEEYMSDILKEYCKTHDGDFIAVVEHVCRVKAVE